MVNDIRDLTIEEVKKYLRVENNLEDTTITIMLEASKSMILSFLNVDSFEYYLHYYDSNGNIIGDREIPKEFTMASLMLCSHWYERRELVTGRYEQGKQLPFGFETILAPHRNYLKGVD